MSVFPPWQPKFFIHDIDESRAHDRFNITSGALWRELRGRRSEVERLPIGASPDTNQDEGDTSTRESASAGDAVKPVLCSRGGCRYGDGSSVCGDNEDALSWSLRSVYEDN